MKAGAFVIVVVFMTFGVLIGWHARSVKSAHSDVKVGKSRIHSGRQGRLKSGLAVLALAVLAVIIVAAAARS